MKYYCFVAVVRVCWFSRKAQGKSCDVHKDIVNMLNDVIISKWHDKMTNKTMSDKLVLSLSLHTNNASRIRLQIQFSTSKWLCIVCRSVTNSPHIRIH